MADVFISYARDDEPVARRIAKALQPAGLDVWWDANLPAHRAYSEEIERNLEAAKAVVVLWSRTAAKSQWVRAEADFARNANKLVQGTVDGTLPPMPFNQIQCADLRGWRGRANHAGWTKLRGSIQAVVSGEEALVEPVGPPSVWDRFHPYRWWAAAGLALLVAAAVWLLLLGQPRDDRKPVLAVLPFKSLDARDASLVAGIWEDTRQALSRNPQLLVLGLHTSEELAQKGGNAARRAADYLVEANVRSVGDRVRVSANLVRTKDRAQIWSATFERRLDDVFELQSHMAGEIEGRIRGRLAERGGVRPEHIATTGEVYALYSDARSKIRGRDFRLYPRAREQLVQVVKLDPNFAPAWAALSVVVRILPPDQTEFNPYDRAELYARKAIELAPNLASGHGALALALNLNGPVARAEVERAVQLDPNDYEAVLWLGNMLNSEGHKTEALAAYTRAAEIEPLFWPAVLNKLGVLNDLQDQAGIQQLIETERRLGADHLVAAIQMELASDKGDLAEAARLGLDYLKTGRQDGRPVINIILWQTFLQLGLLEQAQEISPGPRFAPNLWRNDPKGLDMVDSLKIAPRKFFSMSPLPQNAGRVYVLSGRSKRLADMYLSLNVSPDEFVSLSGGAANFLYTAPIVAAALQQNGHSADAGRLLATAEREGRERIKDGAPESNALLARVYAAQGRKDEALALLTSAVNGNWIPRPPMMMPDLAIDPPWSPLKGDPRFERLRERILGTIRKERAELGAVKLN